MKISRHLTPPYRRPHAVLAILFLALFWYAFIAIFGQNTYYSVGQIEHFRAMQLWEFWRLVDDGTFARFSPLLFAPLGWLDFHVLVPLLGQANETAETLAVGQRTVWLHPLFLAASCAVAASLVWKWFRDARLVALAILLIGLADTVGFQLRFPPLIGFYLIHICTLLALWHFVRLAQKPAPRDGWLLALYTVLPLLIWEQGLDLPIAMAAALCISQWQERSATKKQALLLILLFTAIYLVFRVPSGLEEALGQKRENSFFFAYGNPLPMFDDLLFNISGLFMQAWRQFLPMPPLALSVITDIDMNALNTYNPTYTAHPNMFYRLAGLWYSGVAFACSVALVIYSVRLGLRKKGWEKQLILGALCLFLLGMSTHLPIMHRDYFYIPGYALGYKICVSYIGFVLLILIAAREFLQSLWFRSLSERGQRKLLGWFVVYFCLAALSRAVLGLLPNIYPW